MQEYFSNAVAPLAPEGIMIHLGENDINLCMNNNELFDTNYLDFIKLIKSCNKKCRIALVSVANPQNNKAISQMNRRIKAIGIRMQNDPFRLPHLPKRTFVLFFAATLLRCCVYTGERTLKETRKKRTAQGGKQNEYQHERA